MRHNPVVALGPRHHPQVKTQMIVEKMRYRKTAVSKSSAVNEGYSAPAINVLSMRAA
jgi:hypothetical protein